MKKKGRIQINLLQKKREMPELKGKLIYFILHYLRYVIVLTQIIVIGVFFYRFIIDQEVVELKESIGQKQEIVKATLPLIVQAQAIQNKSEEIKKTITKQDKFADDLTYVFSLVPQDIILDSFTVTPSGISFDGVSADYRIVKLFYERLKKEQRFKDVVLSDVSKTTTFFEFSMSITI
ncbi:MAG TPA: PilN domain-containing protein [Patescibacteria group bacterium]|nr:PilN domain-containing protein [Patescibacteria group bacterium]